MSEFKAIEEALEVVCGERSEPPLREALASLDQASAEPLPGRLKHFLTNRSYSKALEWLRSQGD